MKRLLFILLVLFLPSQLGLHFWPQWSLVNGIRVDYLSPTLYFTDVIVVLIIIFSIRSLRVSKKILIPVILFMTLNIVISFSPFVSVYQWLKVIELTLLSIIVFKYKDMVKAAVSAALPYTLLWSSSLAVLQWFQQGSLNGLWYWLGERRFTAQTPGIALSKLGTDVSLRPYATFPHPNVLAGFIVVSILLLLQYGKKNLLTWASAILSLIVLFLTQSYSAWIALILILLFFTLRPFIKVSEYWWKVFITGIFCISFCLPLLPTLPSFQSVSQSTKERLELTFLAARSISDHPILGTGLGTFVTSIPRYTSSLPQEYRTRATSWFQPVHNVPLLVVSEIGIIGIVPMYLFLMSLPISLPLLSILVISLFDHYWITLQSSAILFAIVVGLTYNSHKK